MFQDRCVKTFFISFILLIIILIFRFQLSDSDIKGEVNEERYWVLKTFAKPEFDMVIMGDSRAFCGVSPATMENVLGEYRILNFGYSLGGLNSQMYQEAFAKLNSKSKKKTILIAVTPSSLLQKTASNTSFFEKKNMSKEYVYLLTNYHPLMYAFNPMKFEKMIPLYYLNKIRPLFKKNRIGKKYRVYYNDGWVAAWDEPENQELYLRPFHNMFSNNKISDSLVNDLIKQTREWIEQDIRVFGFRPPSTKKMEDLENELSGFDEREFSKKFEVAGGVWLSFEVEKYHSIDGSHLHKDSAIQFSKDLARYIDRMFEN